jgi:DNA-binding transcriptional LysR family regulator
MVRDAALAGAGAALLPRSIVAGDLAAGRLDLWGALAGGAVELWALHPSRRLMSAKVRAFVDHLVAAFPDGALDAPGG